MTIFGYFSHGCFQIYIGHLFESSFDIFETTSRCLPIKLVTFLADVVDYVVFTSFQITDALPVQIILYRSK